MNKINSLIKMLFYGKHKNIGLFYDKICLALIELPRTLLVLQAISV